jgi:hypothetical protein
MTDTYASLNHGTSMFANDFEPKSLENKLNTHCTEYHAHIPFYWLTKFDDKACMLGTYNSNMLCQEAMCCAFYKEGLLPDYFTDAQHRNSDLHLKIHLAALLGVARGSLSRIIELVKKRQWVKSWRPEACTDTYSPKLLSECMNNAVDEIGSCAEDMLVLFGQAIAAFDFTAFIKISGWYVAWNAMCIFLNSKGMFFKDEFPPVRGVLLAVKGRYRDLSQCALYNFVNKLENTSRNSMGKKEPPMAEPTTIDHKRKRHERTANPK